MSEGKASIFRVVSAEELRRRALAAARERLDRANRDALELSALVSAAEATYGGLDVRVPAGRTSASNDPAVIDRLAHEVETQVAATRVRAQDAIAEARRRHLSEAAASMLTSLPPTEPLAALSTRTPASSTAVGKQLEHALRILGRLPGDASADAVERCERLVARIGTAGSTAQGDVLLAALRTEVQSARHRSDIVSRNREELARLYRELDGLAGEEVSSLRGYLRGLPLDSPLPPELASRVENVKQEALREQDRRFALQVIREVLEEQGYDLGADFVTVVASVEGVVLPLSASRRHGVRVRERAGQLLFNVVRFDKTADGVSDAAAATAFCEEFETIVHRANETGLSLTRVVHFEPGSGRIEVRNDESPFAEDAKSPKRSRLRERRSS